MGIYDRDYYREISPRSGRRRTGGGWMMVSKIIVLNIIVFFANGLFTGENNAISVGLGLQPGMLWHPLQYWHFLSYGFVHSPENIWHIAGNMIGLFCLGYEVERRLGSYEFLRFYLISIVFAGLCWVFTNLNHEGSTLCWGASGGVVAVIVLFAIMYPHRTLLLYGIIPIPAWAIGVLVIAPDLWGAFGGAGREGIAITAHLGGAAFAIMYYNYGWNFGRLFNVKSKPKQPKKPKLDDYYLEKVEKKPDSFGDVKTQEKLDKILKKYSEKGESSLTAEEREFLKETSSEYQKKLRK